MQRCMNLESETLYLYVASSAVRRRAKLEEPLLPKLMSKSSASADKNPVQLRPI